MRLPGYQNRPVETLARYDVTGPGREWAAKTGALQAAVGAFSEIKDYVVELDRKRRQEETNVKLREYDRDVKDLQQRLRQQDTFDLNNPDDVDFLDSAMDGFDLRDGKGGMRTSIRSDEVRYKVWQAQSKKLYDNALEGLDDDQSKYFKSKADPFTWDADREQRGLQVQATEKRITDIVTFDSEEMLRQGNLDGALQRIRESGIYNDVQLAAKELEFRYKHEAATVQQEILSGDPARIQVVFDAMSADDYPGVLDPKTRYAFRRQARIELNRVEKKKDWQTKYDFENAILDAENGVQGADARLAEIVSSQEPNSEKQFVMSRQAEIAIAQGQEFTSIQNQTQIADVERGRQLRSAVMSPEGDSVVDNAKFASFVAAKKKKDAMFNADPAAYSIQYDTSTNATRAVMDQAAQMLNQSPNDPLAIDNFRDAQQEYYTNLATFQIGLGRSIHDVQYLTKPEVENHGERLRTQDVQEFSNEVVAMANQYGSSWPVVQRQLVREKKISGEHIVLSSLTSPRNRNTRFDLASAIQAPKKDLIDAIGDRYSKTDLSKELTGQFAEFYTMMHRLDPTVENRKNLSITAERLALYYMAGGMDAADAAKKVYKGFISDNFKEEMISYEGEYGGVIKEGILVPIDQSYSADDISRGLESIRRQETEKANFIPLMSMLQGVTPGEELRASRELLQEEAYFISNPSQTGAVMVWPNGMPVRRINEDGMEEIVEYEWAEIGNRRHDLLGEQFDMDVP